MTSESIENTYEIQRRTMGSSGWKLKMDRCRLVYLLQRLLINHFDVPERFGGAVKGLII